MSDLLQILANNRDNILLSEIGALIHNLGKMSEEHLFQHEFDLHLFFGDFLYDILKQHPELHGHNYWVNAQKAQSKFYPPQLMDLLKKLKISFDIPPLNDRSYELREFSSLRMRNLYNDKFLDNLLNEKTSLLGKLLSEAHGRAVGADKGFTIKTEANQQDPNFIHLSTAFGNETQNISSRNIKLEQSCLLLNLQLVLQRFHDFLIEKKRKKINSNVELNSLRLFHREINDTLKKFTCHYIADTRYPINDIDLYSFHHTTASFFKSGIAKILLEGKSNLIYEDISKFTWKLLSIRYNGLDYLMQARGVNDILAKQSVIRETLDELRYLFEIKYPLANEVFRDENGSAYLFPALDDSTEKKLKRDIENKIEAIFKKKLGGELKPEIQFSYSSRQALKLGEMLSDYTPKFNQFYPTLEVGSPEININRKNINVDLCQSCSLRFIGHGLTGIARHKAFTRKLCGVCYKRRDSRAENWWKNENYKTIWMDEIADENGQLALVVGNFELENWLDGWWLNSMLTNSIDVIREKSENNIISYWDLLKKFDKAIKNRNIRLSEILGKKKKTNPIYQEIYNVLNTHFNFLNEYSSKPIYELLKDIPDPFNLFVSFKLTQQSLTNLENEKEAPKQNILKELMQLIEQKFINEDEFLNTVREKIGEEQFEKHNEKILKQAVLFKGADALFLISNSKKVSFARISSIWHQTKDFNINIPSMLQTCFRANKRNRIKMMAEDNSKASTRKTFKTTHVYEFEIGKLSLSFYCYKGSENNNTNLEFISVVNWDYIEKQFNFDWTKELYAGRELKEEDENLSIIIQSVEEDNQTYYPYSDILLQPQMFMILVPASQAINTVNLIKKKYDEQFSKGKNRLPLNMGIVFAKRRQPLYTIIEAGRKILNGFNSKAISLKIKRDSKMSENSNEVPLEFIDVRRNEDDFYKAEFQWNVNRKLGDPSKEDYYYPYFFTDYEEENQIKDRLYIFKAPLPGEKTEWKYLCHVSELKDGDKVYITPSFFDFEFLEVPGRRFDLNYKNNIREQRQSRPFFLDEVEQLQQVWELISGGGLTDAKFRGLLEVIERKRDSWLKGNKIVSSFDKFVKHTLHAQVNDWYQKLNEKEKALILAFGQNGRLLDVFELYMKILKQRLKE